MGDFTPYSRWNEFRRRFSDMYREPSKIVMNNFHRIYPELLDDINFPEFSQDYMEVSDQGSHFIIIFCMLFFLPLPEICNNSVVFATYSQGFLRLNGKTEKKCQCTHIQCNFQCPRCICSMNVVTYGWGRTSGCTCTSCCSISALQTPNITIPRLCSFHSMAYVLLT